MRNVIDSFKNAMREYGIDPPAEIVADGRMHRFGTNGRPGDDAGFYALHVNGIATGLFGDWRTGAKRTWYEKSRQDMSNDERAAFRANIGQLKAGRDAEAEQRRQAARSKATALWQAARPVGQSHPYLELKRIAPVSTLRELDIDTIERVLGYRPKSRGEPLKGRILLAPVKVGSTWSTMELIDEAGRKSAIFGGQKRGGYWVTAPLPEGDGADYRIFLGEGVATVLTASELTGDHAVAALSSENLANVARVMRRLLPEANLVVLADTGNGEAAAREAAAAVGARLLVPDFGGDRPDGATDFNDLAVVRGRDLCLAQLNAVPSTVSVNPTMPAPPTHLDQAPPPEGASDEARTRDVRFSLDISEVTRLYAPPDPVYGVAVQRSRLVALTAPTNHAKTAVAITIAIAVASGQPIGVDEVTQGKVLVLCGENPEDFAGRLLATASELQIPLHTLAGRVRIIPHSFPLNSKLAEVQSLARSLGELVLVVVDTNASYYGYDDENDNVNQRQQAADLRELTRLPGKPAVLVTCHTVKNATRDNLMPRGGVAFLNEIDSNLTVWKDGDVATLHHQHKIRGPSFEPIPFNIKLCPIPDHLDAKGRVPQTVVAVHLTESQAEFIERRAIQDENRLLAEMTRNPRDSIAGWAKHLGWVTPSGQPHKSKVHRLLSKLKDDKLIEKKGRHYVVSKDGNAEIHDANMARKG